jgi:putative Mg2+ transporter-C (MgtC) family protein
MTRVDFIIRILMAFLLGGLIGVERQYRQRMAGIKTNVLVCIGACLFVMFSNIGGGEQNARLAAQVVSGIGFLGGGVIIREGLNIRGLTTAATLWCAAAIGILTSQGYFFEATAGALVIVMANIILRPIARIIDYSSRKRPGEEILYEITVKCHSKDEPRTRSLLMEMVREEKIILRNLESEEVEGTERVRIVADIICIGRSDRFMEEVVSRISQEEGVVSVGWHMEGSVEH